MKIRVVWFILLIVLMINGCGGGGGGSSSFTEGSNNPAFVSKADIPVELNDVPTFSFKVVAKDVSNVKYYITGQDSHQFSIDVITGELTFLNINNIEVDSVYKFVVLAEDSVGHREMQDITVKVIKPKEQPKEEPTVEEDKTAPKFSSATKHININEGEITLFRAIATDENEVSYSINSGDDAGSFVVDSETGVVSFISQSNHNIKSSYKFNIVAVDSYGNESTQEIRVNIIKSIATPTPRPTWIST